MMDDWDGIGRFKVTVSIFSAGVGPPQRCFLVSLCLSNPPGRCLISPFVLLKILHFDIFTAQRFKSPKTFISLVQLRLNRDCPRLQVIVA